MSIFDALLSSFSLLTWDVLLVVVLAVAFSQFFAAIPGLGGVFVLVMLIPVAVVLDDTMLAVALVLSAGVVANTGNSFTSILFGVPGSAAGVATIFDGYPMARKGEAERALAASFTASAVGGVIGVIALIVLIPVVRPVVLAFGHPEFFVLALLAVIFIGFVATGSMIRSVIAGGAGLLLAFVGQEPTTATLRFTFDQIYLWDGIPLLPFLIGLFAIAEMMNLAREGGSVSNTTNVSKRGQIFQGIRDTFTHWKATLQSSVIGVIVGLVPGLGGETSQFMSYSYVAKTSKNSHEFGKGTVEGVIAAEASTNSKEGGSMVPTMLLGIPGSANMAVILLILVMVGVRPGQDMIENNLDLLYAMAWIVAIASVLATLMCLAFTNIGAKATSLPGHLIIGPVFVISMFAAYIASSHFGDIIVAVVAGLIGYVMIRYGYPRSTLVIGFVLGGIVENNYLLSMRLYGWEFFNRPITLGLLGVSALIFVIPLIGGFRKSLSNRRKV